MRAAVRYFISPDIDLENYWPEDLDDFSFLLQVIVGPAGPEGDESIQLLVCTTRSLARRVAVEGIVFGRSLVIVDSPDIKRILNSVRAFIERVEGDSWSLLGAKLARIGVYEFEDFV